MKMKLAPRRTSSQSPTQFALAVLFCASLLGVFAKPHSQYRWLYLRSRDPHFNEESEVTAEDVSPPRVDRLVVWLVATAEELNLARNDVGCLESLAGHSVYVQRGLGLDVETPQDPRTSECDWTSSGPTARVTAEFRRKANRIPLFLAATAEPRLPHAEAEERAPRYHVMLVTKDVSDDSEPDSTVHPCSEARKLVKFVRTVMERLLTMEDSAQWSRDGVSVIVGTDETSYEGADLHKTRSTQISAFAATFYRMFIGSLLPAALRHTPTGTPCSTDILDYPPSGFRTFKLAGSTLLLSSPSLTPLAVFHSDTSLETGNNLTLYKVDRAKWCVCSQKVVGAVLALRDVEMWFKPASRVHANLSRAESMVGGITAELNLRFITDTDACMEHHWFEKKVEAASAFEQNYRHGALGVSRARWPMFADCSTEEAWISYPPAADQASARFGTASKPWRYAFAIDEERALQRYIAAEIVAAMAFQNFFWTQSGLGRHGVHSQHAVHLHSHGQAATMCNFYIGQFVGEDAVRLPQVELPSAVTKGGNLSFGMTTSADELWSGDGWEVGVVACSAPSNLQSNVIWTRTDGTPRDSTATELDRGWIWEWRVAWAVLQAQLHLNSIKLTSPGA